MNILLTNPSRKRAIRNKSRANNFDIPRSTMTNRKTNKYMNFGDLTKSKIELKAFPQNLSSLEGSMKVSFPCQ